MMLLLNPTHLLVLPDAHTEAHKNLTFIVEKKKKTIILLGIENTETKSSIILLKIVFHDA